MPNLTTAVLPSPPRHQLPPRGRKNGGGPGVGPGRRVRGIYNHRVEVGRGGGAQRKGVDEASDFSEVLRRRKRPRL